jgi:hypothetical protein
MTVYKVSVVVRSSDYPGAILNLNEEPKIGDSIRISKDEFVVTEVIELMPPRGDFHFLHVTCEPKTS